MPRLYNPSPNVTTVPGRNDALAIRLNDKVDPGGTDCECSITGFFWENPELEGDFDTSNIDITIGGGGGGEA